MFTHPLNAYQKFTFWGLPAILIYLVIIYLTVWPTVNLYPVRYTHSFAEGIDFARDGYPEFIEKVTGISAKEDWGRWTNQYRGRTIFTFKENLPKQFLLEIEARPFASNAEYPTIIRVGDAKVPVLISNPQMTTYQIPIIYSGATKSLEIIPPNPQAPGELNPHSKDGRKIGLGLRSLRIIPIS